MINTSPLAEKVAGRLKGGIGCCKRMDGLDKYDP